MENIYEDGFIKLLLDEAHGIIEMAWLPDSTHMSDEQFKQCMLIYADLVEQHRPSFLLSYSEGGAFLMMPHLQEWLDKEIVPRTYHAGVTASAFVMHKDFIVEIAAEQAMEEPNARIRTVRFLPTYEKARHWLLKLAEAKISS